MHSNFRRTGTLLIAACSAASVATLEGVLPSAAAPTVAPATTPGAVTDGPGAFYVFRTLDSGLEALPSDDTACNSYFGSVRSGTVLERLNANLYGFTSSQASGYITDQTSTLLGPGYVCDAPGFSGADTIEQYGRLTPPGFVTAATNGFCGLTFPTTQATWTLTNCALAQQPNGSDITGGVSTSNSVVNLLHLPGTPTGSLWTEYVVGTPHQSVIRRSLPSKPTTGAVHYVVGREVNSTSIPSSSCAGGQRSTELHAITTDQTTGKVVGEPAPEIAGLVSVCYSGFKSPDFAARLTLTLEGFSPALSWTVSGHCRPQPVRGIIGSVQQSCGWTLPADIMIGLKGGLVTVNGLVPAGNPAASTNSALWTIGLLGGPPPTS